MPTKTDLVKAKLAKKPNPTPEEIKKWAEEIGCSPSLVYKWLRKMPAERRMAIEPAEPVVTIGEEPEEVIEEVPAEEEFEVPAEFIEEKPAEEEAVEEIVIEEEAKEAEEERLLREISKRAIKRFFGIAIEEGLGLGKELGLTDQEAEDTEVLTMLLLAKYLTIEIRENLLEITSGLHFGSLGLKLLVAWIKKRREEKRKEEEKPVKKPTEITKEVEAPSQEKPLTTEERADLCVACKKQPQAPNSKLGLCLQCQKKAEKGYVKKITGGL